MLSRRQNQAFASSPPTTDRTVHRQTVNVDIKPLTRGIPATRSKRSNLWYALYFPTLPSADPHLDSTLISAVAQHCQHISDYISVDGEDALVVEIGRSLRYFGGLARIRQGLESGIPASLRHSNFVQAVAPSASASLLMARTGLESVIGSPEDLRSRLGGIPTSALAMDARVRSKLAKCGLFYLRDIWRLPLPELRIRFGRHFSDYIEQCLGLRPEIRQRWQPRPDFRVHLDAAHGLYSAQQIVSACEQLLHQLESFLKNNHLCTDQLIFFMDHAAHHRETITVNVRNAERSAQLFLLLLETQLSAMTLAGEVYGITLEVRQFSDFKPAGGLVHKSQLLDTLAARLGSESVQRLRLQQDYCPEFATRMVSYLTQLPEDDSFDGSNHGVTSSQNPCWLLQPPRPLHIRNHKLYYLSPLTLLRGPRRIETRWWQDQGIRRDYYVAANLQGHLLWIYQDLAHSTMLKDQPATWYLHGFFG